MEYRILGSSKLRVSEIGYGAWALGGSWGQQSDEDSRDALRRYIELGGNFIDTAQAYGDGRSERVIAEVSSRDERGCRGRHQTPPRKGRWGPPSWTPLEKIFPVDYVVEGVEFSLRNLGVECLDVYQLHTWCESWSTADDLFAVADRLKRQGKIRAFGISTTESFPECVLGELRTGAVDTLQVIFNLFEQHPRETLFPTCQEFDVGVIVRVPFDEGVLTGKFTADSTFPADDFRRHYFRGQNLRAAVERVDVIREWQEQELPDLSLADLALAWILSHEAVGTVIPGIRNISQAEKNLAAAALPRLTAAQLNAVSRFAWRRNPWAEDLPTLEDL